MSNSVIMSIWEELYGDEIYKKTTCKLPDFCSCKKAQKVKGQKLNNKKKNK